MDISTASWELQVKLNYSPSLLLTVASVLKITGFRFKSFIWKKAFNLPNVRKDRKVRYLRWTLNALQNFKLHRFTVRCRVDIKLPGAVFKFHLEKRRHQAQIRPDWATTTFACRLHILSRPGGCQSLMTEVYYILPNKVTKWTQAKPYLGIANPKVSTLTFIIFDPKIRGVYLMT